MADSVKSYTPLQPETRDMLVEQWLPELLAVRDRRRGIRRAMVASFVTPLVLIVAGIVWSVARGDPISLFEGSAFVLLSGWSAVSFKYLGKLQACDDALTEISLTVRLGFVEPMLKAIPKLSCYSQFEGVIADVRNILPK